MHKDKGLVLQMSTHHPISPLPLMAQGFEKITNAHLLERCSADAHGSFLATARFARQGYQPRYAQLLGEFSPGYQNIQIAIRSLKEALADQEVLSLELREFASL